MEDRFGRIITYLRISVIDKCNLRCSYCMPAGFLSRIRMDELLTNDELVTLAGIFVELGVRKIRLTGGEPLLRPGIADVIRRLAAIPSVEELALSTNGVLLKRCAAGLSQAGLQRVNVSLDTLKAERFAQITGMNCWQEVIDGILAARELDLRFIEWMPTTSAVDQRRADRFLSNEAAKERIERYWRLIPADGDVQSGAA
jgi:cyclic pyranopterin phosphate synthase